MAVTTPPDNLVRAEGAELSQLRDLVRALAEIVDRGGETATLTSPSGEEVEIPASAFQALRLAVEGMARGQAMTLIPHGKELTTQEAADLLHVSRPHLVKLLDEGTIPHHRVGTHRRVKIEDVLAYRAERARQRRDALRELTRLAEETEGGYE